MRRKAVQGIGAGRIRQIDPTHNAEDLRIGRRKVQKIAGFVQNICGLHHHNRACGVQPGQITGGADPPQRVQGCRTRVQPVVMPPARIPEMAMGVHTLHLRS